MSGSARVDSIDAIKEFRVYLTKFREMASDALGDADSDLNRMQSWLEVEQSNFWNGQMRKRQEAVVKAEEALRHKRLYKDSTGGTPSAVDEQKALSVARKNLAEAQQKIVAIKQWIRRLQKETILYRGGVARFSGTVSGMIPTAIGHLAQTEQNLEKYIGLGPAPAVGGVDATTSVGAGRGEGGASMSRGDGQEIEAEEELPDPEALRKQGPSEQEIGAATKQSGALAFSCGSISGEDQKTLAELLLGEAAADEAGAVVISRQAASAKRIWLMREAKSSKAGWRIGEVDGGAANGYNIAATKQLLADRADLTELLRMPDGWLAVLGGGGLVAVFNQRNERVFPQPGAPEQAAAADEGK